MAAIDAGWVALSLQRNIGGKTLRALLDHFGTVPAILAASPADLQQVRGVGPKIAQAITRIDTTATTRAMSRWQAAGVQIIPRDFDAYPANLLDLPDEPPTLFTRGDWESYLVDQAVAVVGTRNPTERSAALALSIGARLAAVEQTVVSGLAQGIDTAAHQGALSLRGGRTVAVLGCGVLTVYPPANRGLANRILQQGALMCECAPDATPNAPRLVSRNRIIAGLVQSLIVVQTSANGGAMYAARAALSLGRTVYAVDSPADGNQTLLTEGAIALAPDLSNWPFT